MSTGPGSVPEGHMSRLPYRVTGAYEGLLQEFRRVVEDANQTVSSPEAPLLSCFRPSGDNSTVTFETCLCLKNWPCKKLPRGKRLYIRIKVLEILERLGTLPNSSWGLIKSTVYLNYIVVSDASAHLAQSLHFDFVGSGQTDHPIFHVQLTDELIPEADLRGTGSDLELKLTEPSTECWVTTRIPTSDMTFASVLYCIVADHLGTNFFRDFAERVHSIQERLPQPSFEALKNSLQDSSLHFKSSHWFAHLREPTQHPG